MGCVDAGGRGSASGWDDYASGGEYSVEEMRLGISTAKFNKSISHLHNAFVKSLPYVPLFDPVLALTT